MAELPEVEAAKRLVNSHCLGATIVKAIVDNDTKVIDGVTPAVLQEALTGKKILNAHRKGKHMWLQLDSTPWPSYQFGMSGALIVKDSKGSLHRSPKVSEEEEAFPTTHSKVHLQLDNGVEVVFADKRRFARVRLLDDPSKVPPISELGFDAYLELPSAEHFTEAIKSKKGCVKALLLDQSFLSGIGNWVGDEVLYQAKIHPEQSVNSLKEEEVARLHTAIREVLDKAVSVDGDQEQYPQSWLCHHREGKKLGMIDGNQIETISISGRTSVFVSNIQKYTGPELKGAKTRQAIDEDAATDPDSDDENVEEVTEGSAAEKGASGEKTGVTETPKRGRGRPPKNKGDSPAKSPATASPAATPGARKRGRPAKLRTPSRASDGEEGGKDSEPAKRRGRPPKAKIDVSKESVSKSSEETPVSEVKDVQPAAGEADLASPPTPKRRGRPPKAKPEAAEEVEVAKKAKVEEAGATPKRRGRPPKAKSDGEGEGEDDSVEAQTQVAEAAATTPTPKKRGRPPKAKSSS